MGALPIAGKNVFQDIIKCSIALFAGRVSSEPLRRRCYVERSLIGCVLVFRTAQTEFALRAKNIAVKVGDPLSSARRNVEVADRALDMRRYASPIELGVKISEVGRRAVAELFIHSDFFKFA